MVGLGSEMSKLFSRMVMNYYKKHPYTKLETKEAEETLKEILYELTVERLAMKYKKLTDEESEASD